MMHGSTAYLHRPRTGGRALLMCALLHVCSSSEVTMNTIL